MILETNQPEQILTRAETLEKLRQVVLGLTEELPVGLGLEQFDTPATQAQHLLDSVCELPLGPEAYLQWYAVRLEK